MADFSALEGRFYTMGEMERATGVSAATIRAWERRYGIPKPARSSGRHRLYSEDDLSLLKWLVERLREGMSISRAIALWRLQATRPGLADSAGRGVAREGQSIENLRSAWLSACLRLDRKLAQSVLEQAFALYSATEVCEGILTKGLSAIGDAWFRGEISVHQEHFASGIASQQLERLIALISPWRGERIILACPPGEQHSIGLLFLALLLRQRGLDTIYLGPNVPTDGLDSTVAQARPSFAVLSAQRLPDAAALIEMAGELARLGLPVGYGGLIFNQCPSLRERVPGHFLGEEITSAPDVVDNLLSEPRPTPQVSPPSEENSDALRRYALMRPEIEAEVESIMGGSIAGRALAEASEAISSHIVAGLKIGDFSPLDAGRPWLEAAFRGTADPVATTRSFLAAYRLAARGRLLGNPGPILDWLDEQAS